MVRLVKNLPGKLEDLSICNSNTAQVETGGSMGLTDQPV